MSSEKPTKTWSKRDIDRFLEIFRRVEEPGFVAATWPDLPVQIVDGVKVMTMPYPIYDPVIDKLWDLAYRSSLYIEPYAPLPEDPIQEGVRFSVVGAHFPPEYFETATLDQVRRYLVLCTRGERFCDGHIASQFENGSMVAALKRLKRLRAAMD
jgi:hypothetical protein